MNRTHWPLGVPHHLDIPETSLYYNLEVTAQRYSGKVATRYYGADLTYGELKHQVDVMAGFLQQHCAVKRGDRVALFMKNSPQFIIALYAILRADAMVVPVNTMNRLQEVTHIVQDSGSRVAIFGQELSDQIAPLLGRDLDHAVVATYSDYIDAKTDLPLPDIVSAVAESVHETISWRAALDQACLPGPHLAGPEDLSVMPYTSGTTGKPKGCVHTHRSVMHTALAGPEWCKIPKDATVLAALPMFHVTGLQNGVNSPIFGGASIVIMTRWDKRCAAMLIERYRITTWTAIPTMLFDFLNQADLGERDLGSLHSLTGGGAAMPKAVAERIRALWGIDYVEGYGLSETIAPTHINPPHRPKPQCLGLPIFDTRAIIIDVDTLKPLGVGKSGEILVNGPQVFLRYHGDEERSAEAFIDIDGVRYFRTGDLGYVDEEGYFFMVDRLKRMINASGFKVWPAEVEAYLYAHPAVLEACVIACRDEHRGESVKALIVRRPDQAIDEASLIAWAREQMSAYKVPHAVEFVDSLPKNAAGKVLWRMLQENALASAG